MEEQDIDIYVYAYIYNMYAYIKSITVDLLYVALRLVVPLFLRRDSDDPYMSMVLWLIQDYKSML